MPTAVAKKLARFVIAELEQGAPRYQWSQKLRAFLDDLRSTILTWKATNVHSPEQVIPIPKARAGNGHKYRVLVRFNLKASVIDSVFAGYLRQIVDPYLDPHSFAFRLPKGGKPVTHHDAVSAAVAFSREVPNKALWVAECDIKGFFDSVAHTVTRRRLAEIVDACELQPLDERLLKFVESFLAGYDYVDARRRGIAILAAQKVTAPVVFDVVEELATTGLALPAGERVGIPQGSAFSCVLANIILEQADRRCRAAMGSHQRSFYARYCDDVLIMSSSKRVTRKAASAYQASLTTLRLPFHRLAPVSASSLRKYWDVKSKDLYCWTHGGVDGFTWIGFLGYQFRRDGVLRPRRSSIKKELAKQHRVVNDIIAAVDRARVRALRSGTTHRMPTLRRIRFRALMHLVSIGVGYPRKIVMWPAHNAVSWASGFQLLRSANANVQALRILDRGRHSAIGRLMGRLQSLVNSGAIEQLPAMKVDREDNLVEYAGRPLSYVGQFKSPS